MALAAHVAEYGLVSHQWEERPLKALCPSVGECGGGGGEMEERMCVWVEEHSHRSSGSDDMIRCFRKGGKPGKGITFGM